MTIKIVYGKKLAEKIRIKTTKEVEHLKSIYKITPNINTIKIGDNPSSELYFRLRNNACNKAGITTSHLDFRKNVTEKKILKTIDELNSNKNIHGILIQFPIPDHISSNKLMSAIDPKKDVEGFNPYNMGKTIIGDEYIVPCTPLAILTILKHEKIDLEGKEIVIINHSTVVGKPLTTLLLNRNATVTVCHIFTKDTKQHSSNADIIITATGIPGLITKDYVKNGAFVIDVGIAETNDGISGDVNFDSVKEKAGKITPVPGGVGPVTIACSLENMLKTYKNCMMEKKL